MNLEIFKGIIKEIDPDLNYLMMGYCFPYTPNPNITKYRHYEVSNSYYSGKYWRIEIHETIRVQENRTEFELLIHDTKLGDTVYAFTENSIGVEERLLSSLIDLL